jgi:hypothetical protein
MNRKGQVLVFFVILIPILVALAAYSVDMAYIYYRSTKLNNLNHMVLEYGLKHIKDADVKKKMNDLLYKNDNDIDDYEIVIENNKISISANKKIDSIFGRAINIDVYQLSSSYTGYIKSGKTVIEKG